MAYAIGQYIVNNSDNSYGALDTKNIASSIENAQELMDNVERIEVDRIDHLGVQAGMGSFLAVNGELVEIGRTHSYELLFNKVSITSLKVLSADTYIIDYKYAF